MLSPAPASLLLLAPALLLACTPEEPSAGSPARAEVLLTEDSSARLAGSLTVGALQLAFDARGEEATRPEVVLHVGERVLRARLDGAAGWAELDGGGAVLSAPEREALTTLAGALAGAQGAEADALPAPARALLGLLGYWAEAPEGYAHVRRVAPLRADAEGVACVRRGQATRASYGARPDGQPYVEYVVAGADYGPPPEGGEGARCMGRCGAGCEGFSLHGRTTRDCLVLDVCRYRGQAGCAEPYEAALDDFLRPDVPGCGGEAAAGEGPARPAADAPSAERPGAEQVGSL